MPLLPSPCSVLGRQFLPTIKKCAASVQAHGVLDFGPVFLPEGNGFQRIGRDSEAGGKRNLAVSCFGLSLLAREDLTQLLQTMHEASPFVLFADFKVAERNIEAPACLLMGGLRKLFPANAGCFNAHGGLEGLLYAERTSFQVMERHSLLGGSLSCVLARCL